MEQMACFSEWQYNGDFVEDVLCLKSYAIFSYVCVFVQSAHLIINVEMFVFMLVPYLLDFENLQIFLFNEPTLFKLQMPVLYVGEIQPTSDLYS